MFDLDGLEEVDPSPVEVNFDIDGSVLTLRRPSGSTITVEEVLRIFESWGVPYANRLRFLTAESGRTSYGKTDALPVTGVVRLEGPGSVLTAVKVAMRAKGGGDTTGGYEGGTPSAKPAAKKVGLGPLHRSAFRQYQADLRGKVAEVPPDAKAAEDERRRVREEFLRTAETRRKEEQDRWAREEAEWASRRRSQPGRSFGRP